MDKCPFCSQNINDGSIRCESCRRWVDNSLENESVISGGVRWYELQKVATLYSALPEVATIKDYSNKVFTFIPQQYSMDLLAYKDETMRVIFLDNEKSGLPPKKICYPELTMFCKLKLEAFFYQNVISTINLKIKEGEFKQVMFATTLKLTDSLFEHLKNLLRLSFSKGVHQQMVIALETLNHYLSKVKREVYNSQQDISSTITTWKQEIKAEGITQE
tara:strand:- start:64 stop:717 length:654 start_codon:yes stop_codon:yes gene_type:complete